MRNKIVVPIAAFFALLINFTITQPAAAAGFINISSMTGGRGEHLATLLPNGKLLVAGGFDGTNVLATAQVFDPNIGTWSATASMGAARQQQTATLLPNGKVLVAGGVGSPFGFLASAELYNPATGTWTPTGS